MTTDDLAALEETLTTFFTAWRAERLPWRPLREVFWRAEARARDAIALEPRGLEDADLSALAFSADVWGIFHCPDLDLSDPHALRVARERHRRRLKSARKMAHTVPDADGSD